MGFPTFGLLLQGLRLLSGLENKGYYGSCKGYGYYKDSIVRDTLRNIQGFNHSTSTTQCCSTRFT